MSALDKAAKAELERASSISHRGIIILLFRRGRPFCLSLIVGVCACACGRPGGVCVKLRYKKKHLLGSMVKSALDLISRSLLFPPVV